MKQIAVPALIIFFALCSTACKKTTYEVVSTFDVRLASATAFDAQQINLDIQQVKVNYGDTAWVAINTYKQVYNLLNFQNGTDTLIANSELPATSVIKQLKLVLGTQNSISRNGKSLPLTIYNAATELTFLVDRKLNRKVETLTLSFDPARSVSETAEGSYVFKPVVVIK